MEKQIEICFMQSFPSLLEGIFSLTGISKNQIKKYIPKKKLKTYVKAKSEHVIPMALINYGKINPNYHGPIVNVIFEDDDFLILNKPCKIHCHPHGYDQEDTLLSFIHCLNTQLLKVNDSSYDRGLFYRLDFDTSGLMYYAKSNEAYHFMRDNFSEVVKEKNYYAVVMGKTLLQGTLEDKLIASGEKGAKIKISIDGKLCQLQYKRLAYNEDKNVSLLKVKLNQGFRHQIRVQLSAVGHPILGDSLYGGDSYKRLMLHCYQYIFNYNDKAYDEKCSFDNLRDFFTDFNC